MRKLIAQFTRFGLVGLVGLRHRLRRLQPAARHGASARTTSTRARSIAKIISTALAIIVQLDRQPLLDLPRAPRPPAGARGRRVRRRQRRRHADRAALPVRLALPARLHSVLADNISTNVIGLALGTAFRFTLYRLWVFAPHRGEPRARACSPSRTPRSIRGRAPDARRAQRPPRSVVVVAPAATAPAAVAPRSD